MPSVSECDADCLRPKKERLLAAWHLLKVLTAAAKSGCGWKSRIRFSATSMIFGVIGRGITNQNHCLPK
jgi:hypothetical protein